MPAPIPALTHRTVLASAAVDYLVTDPDGLYLDATFGRGGHSRLLLQRLSPRGRLIALDRDPAAQAAAAELADPRFRFFRTRFSSLRDMLTQWRAEERDSRVLQGVLLDVGVSSPQIDDPARGFSLRHDGPLDMRMDPETGESAAQWLARVDVEELTRVLREYGEERFAAQIAKAIVARRPHGVEDGQPQRYSLASTADLAAVVAAAVPKRGRTVAGGAQHPATRTFQALRIYLNQELEELALALDQAAEALAAGGRLAVISFHSLEDRIVKRFIERHARPLRDDPLAARLPLTEDQLPPARLLALARVLPDSEEIAANPRARSAVMRVAERTGVAWHGEAGR